MEQQFREKLYPDLLACRTNLVRQLGFGKLRIARDFQNIGLYITKLNGEYPSSLRLPARNPKGNHEIHRKPHGILNNHKKTSAQLRKAFKNHKKP